MFPRHHDPGQGATEIVTAWVPDYFFFARRFAFLRGFLAAAFFFAAICFPIAVRRLVPPGAVAAPVSSGVTRSILTERHAHALTLHALCARPLAIARVDSPAHFPSRDISASSLGLLNPLLRLLQAIADAETRVVAISAAVQAGESPLDVSRLFVEAGALAARSG